MARTALTLVLVAALSSWASAVSATGPTAADRLRQLASNRGLLQSLLADGLAVSNAGDDTLKRIDACRDAAKTLSRALETVCAETNPDVDRAAELCDHLGEVYAEGLFPALEQARTQFHKGSPGFEQFQTLDKLTAADARAATKLVPVNGQLANHPSVMLARGRLDKAAQQFAAE